MFNICRAIFPIISSEIAKDLKLVKINISNHIAEFFRLVFLKKDLKFAEEISASWISELKRLYLSYNKLKMRLFRNKEILDFFR